MTPDRAYLLIAGMTDYSLVEMGIVAAPEDGAEALEAAKVFFLSGYAGTSPGSMGRLAASIIDRAEAGDLD